MINHLIADSTNQATYTPSAGQLDSPPTLTITDSSGNTISYDGTVAWDSTDSRYEVTLASDEITSSLLWDRLTLKWVWTESGSTLTDYEYAEVVYSGWPSALVYTYDVATYLNVTASETIARLVTAASKAVQQYTGREFASRVTESRYHYIVNSTDTIVPDECVSVSAITDSDGDSVSHTVINGNGTFIKWVELDTATTGQLTITGSWGYQDVPEDVRQAVYLAVKKWYDSDISWSPQDTDFEVIPQSGVYALPSGARYLLEPYRRKRVV